MSQKGPGEAACITDLRERRLGAYREMPNDISAHYNDEGENEEDYYGRFAYELIQNSDDAVGKLEAPEASKKARFELHMDPKPCLIVANTGMPIDEDDTRALTTIGDTTKHDADRKATIGHKGRGFSAVLEITEQPSVFSTDISFMFDRSRSRDCIEEVLAEKEDWSMEDIVGIPLMRLPFAPDSQPDRVNTLLEGEYETVFHFPLRPEAVDSVRTALTELDEQTILFLNDLEQLEVVTGGRKTVWEIARQDSTVEAFDSQVDRIRIRQHGRETNEWGYLRFTRDEIPLGSHTAGISNNTWGDITHTRVSVAIRAERRDDGLHLQPVMNDPHAHVFLPTEERSPVPLLVNGAFDSNLSRTAIQITEQDLDYNRFLIREAARIVGSDIAIIARETATTASEFLSCLDFTTWADPESRDRNSFRDELIRALEAEMADIECVPVDDTSYAAPADILVPTLTEVTRNPVVDFVEHWPGNQIEFTEESYPARGYLPRAELLADESRQVPGILRTLGASEFPLERLPEFLAELPADWFEIDKYPPRPKTSASDPVVELATAVWEQLDEDQQEEFASTARNQPLVPVGTPTEGGVVTRVRAADTELYLPPEGEGIEFDIPGIHFITEYIYRPRGRLGGQALPPEVQRRQNVIKQVWKPDRFQFEELVRTTIASRLSGPRSSDDEDSQLDLRILALLRELGVETADPENPLPLRDRYEAQPLYRLCRLPVPTQEHGWCPAHQVYFGKEWLSGDEARSVDRLFDEAGLDTPRLVSPDQLERQLRDEVAVSDGIDQRGWFNFLRWIGVSPHLRLEPFFGPDEQRRFSDTVAEGGVERPSSGASVLGNLDSSTWQEYQQHLERSLDEMPAGRQRYDSIFRVNSFEYWSEIEQAARQDTAVGRALIDHLMAWWEPVLSEYRDAVLATHSVSGFTGRNSSSQSDGEYRRVGTNLWLWQLQRKDWCPSSRGPLLPDEVWNLPEQQSKAFVLGEQSLLPLLDKTLDPAAHEAQPFLEELGIRRHLADGTFTPRDARIVCEGLESACRTGDVVIAESLREIQPVYRQIQDLAPPVDEPLPEDSDWDTAAEELADCSVLCRVADDFEFREAESAYFARSPSVRADYPFDGQPFFVLEERRAARFGEYFGLHDFTAAVTGDGDPITERDEQSTTVRRHLQECAPYILCRLEAERPSQRLIDQDRQRMESFIENLTLFEEIQVTYTLDPIDQPEELEVTTSTPFYLETKSDGAVEHRLPFIAHRDHPKEQWQLLARALCSYLDVTQFEGIDALLSASSNQERRRYLQYADAPASPEAIQQKRVQLDEGQTGTSPGFGDPEPLGGSDTSDESGSPAERPDGDRQSSADDSGTEAESRHSPMRELYDESQLRVAGEGISVEPTATGSSDPVSPDVPDSLDDIESPEDDPLTETSESNQTRMQAQYDVEDLGAALTEAWEATRLRRDYDCENPEAYIFSTDERHLVEKAREHPNGEHAFQVLEKEAGIPEHFPGFDLLTVNPETGEPDRLIELKAATCRRRKPSVSWNEWTTARNEWIQARDDPLYYLYIVGHLSKSTAPDPYIRTVPNPFRLLDAQVEHDVNIERSIQVDVNRFSEEEPVLEIPVEITSTDP